MYSVEDLLISHGYKLPKQSSSGPSARPAPSASPPSYSRHQQLLERPRTVNGYCSYTLNSSHPRERSQSRQERPISDIGFCDANRSLQLQAKDVSYWRRKAQDFAVLLDYTDYKEAAGGSRQGSYVRPERAEEVRGSGAMEECPRSERPRCRESQQLLPWRTTERKCQSLGAEEWHPAGEQRLLSRTPEGMVLPRTKAKTQSLPRMQTNCRQYVPLFHQSTYRAPRWPDSSRPASANQLSITPKPRFTRPPRPPSYEMHQQIRGSCELLSGRDSVRERTPLPRLRTAESQLDYFAQDCGPPGYIPPPSYKRAPIMEGVCRDYGEVAINYRYRGDVYQQLHRAPDGTHWYPPHAGGCSTTAHSRQLYPVYVTQDRPGARVQYIPFDHSSTLSGNSLTDSDKIRHIRKELPSLTVSEPASGNSAFLPPSLGPSLVGNLVNDSNPAYGEFEGDNSRWHRHLHKETVDNIPATDQNYNSRYHKIQHGCSTSPFSAFHVPASSSGLRCRSEQGFLETITQVKQIRPDLGSDSNRNPKRRFSETIFCLVSVPVHTPTNLNKNTPADQNNNKTTSHTIPDTFAVGLKESRPVRSKSVNQVPIWSHYSTFDTSGTSSLRNYKRAPLRKEIIDAWALQANDNKEMYSRSWPGHQYRNQETQTGSPLVKSPEPEVSENKPTQAVSGISATTTSTNGFPLKDQKNLQLSSNSAFSPLSPTQTPSEKVSPPELVSPLKDSNTGIQPISSPTPNSPAPSADSTEQVSFGQFLLKPVDRRPCDAIGELESINKEMEDTISKRASMSVNRKGKKKHNIHRSGAQSMEDMHLEKPTYINVRSKSFTSAADVDTERSCSPFRPQNKRIPPTQEHTDFAQDSEPTQQDIPVPQESMLRDVGLKVYTETGPAESTPRSCSVPPFQPLDELAWATITTKHSQEHKTHKESRGKSIHKHHTSGVSLRICRSRSESSRSSHKRECSPHVNKLNRVGSCPNNNEASEADEHLENLLIQEKTNSLPAEDFSHLYEVKCAKGIPENESIEQRAARILGIAIPVGALGVEKAEELQESTMNVAREKGKIVKDPINCILSIPEARNVKPTESIGSEETTQHILTNAVPLADLFVEKEEAIQDGNESKVDVDTGIIAKDSSSCIQSIPEAHRLEPTEKICCKETTQHIPDNAFPVEKNAEAIGVVIESKVEEEEGKVEKGSRICSPFEPEAHNQESTENICREETTQQVLGNAIHVGALCVEKAEAVEVVTESKMEEEEGRKEKDPNTSPTFIPGPYNLEPTENICNEGPTQQVLDSPREEQSLPAEVCLECSMGTVSRGEDAMKEGQSKELLEEGAMLRVEEKSNGEVAIHNRQDKSEEHCGSVDFKERQGMESKEEILIALVDDEGIKEVAELPTEDSRKFELKYVGGFEKEGRETNTATGGENSRVGSAKPPKPKQRTKLQKPALLPKPRCVPKREIRLPAHSTTSTEVQNRSDIPENYDPSRVERV